MSKAVRSMEESYSRPALPGAVDSLPREPVAAAAGGEAQRWRRRALELVQAQDRERERLAAGLHDDIGQTLAAATLTLGQLQRLVSAEPAQALLAELRQLLRGAVQATRSACTELRGPLPAATDLRPALEDIARHAESVAGVRVHVQAGAAPLPPEPALGVLLRVARELVLNVCKHARTRHAVLRLRWRRGDWSLSVADDGVGLRTVGTVRRFEPGAGHGLAHAAAQLRALGGALQLRSRPGRGTVVRLRLPRPMPPGPLAEGVPAGMGVQP